jgi:hypothetical protein
MRKNHQYWFFKNNKKKPPAQLNTAIEKISSKIGEYIGMLKKPSVSTVENLKSGGDIVVKWSNWFYFLESNCCVMLWYTMRCVMYERDKNM